MAEAPYQTEEELKKALYQNDKCLSIGTVAPAPKQDHLEKNIAPMFNDSF